MASTDKQQGPAQKLERTQPASSLTEPPVPAGGGLQEIQRIIVDPRVRHLQTELEAVDARRQKDLADLRKELDRSIDRSDDYIKKESTVLGESLVAERRDRSRLVEDRTRELDSRLKATEERLEKLDTQLASEMRDLRKASLDQYRQYAEELRGWRDDVARAIAREITGVRAEKADRTVLAHLLSEVGERLSETAGGADATLTRH